MKILLDITPLGNGYKNNGGRCGIHRVVVETIKAMAADPKMDFYCTTMGSLDAEAKTFWALQSLGESFENRFRSMRTRNAFIHGILMWAKGIHFASMEFKRYNPIRLAAAAFCRILGILFPVRPGTEKWDVYHSTFHELHQGVRAKSRILYVYDAIPAKFPEFFPENSGEQWWKNVRSLNQADDIIICNSNSTKNDLLSLGILDPQRIFSVPLGVDKRFNPNTIPAEGYQKIKEKYSIPNGRWIFTLSAIEPRKNLASVITAMKMISSTHPDIKLVIGGPYGWKMENFLEKTANDAELKNKIVFTGFIDDDDLPAVYSNAPCFVYASFYEGFGLPPIEALACGAPVIASSTSSMPEVLGDGALYINPHEPSTIAAAITEVFDKPLKTLKRAQIGKDIAKKMEWDAFMKRIHSLYLKTGPAQ